MPFKFNKYLIAVIFFAGKLNAQWLEVSSTGDTVLYIDYDYSAAHGDSTAYYLRFFKNSGPGEAILLEAKHVVFLKNKDREGLSEIYEQWHLLNVSEKMENYVGNFLKWDYKIYAFKYRGKGPKVCSRACGRNFYYYIQLDLSIRSGEVELFEAYNIDLVYDKPESGAWGDRLKRAKWPDVNSAIQVSAFEIAASKTRFVCLSWHPGKKKSDLKKPAQEKFFFIR